MSVTVRRMRTQDADAVLRINERITGRPYEAQWASKIIDDINRNPLGCLVAEEGGEIVGFILGDIRGWEFAIPKSGWIEIVGVDPRFQGKGVARAPGGGPHPVCPLPRFAGLQARNSPLPMGTVTLNHPRARSTVRMNGASSRGWVRALSAARRPPGATSFRTRAHQATYSSRAESRKTKS